MTNTADIATLIAHGEKIAAQINAAVKDEAAAVALPDGWSIEKLETLKPQRQYPRGKFNTTHWQDFLAYGKARESEGAVCFINPDNMTARILFDYRDGIGHAKNTADYEAELTPPFLALMKKTDTPLKQRDLTNLLEDWGDDITAYDKDGTAIPTAEAVQLLQTLTVEKAKRIKQTQGDFEHERTISEQAALKKEGRIVAELRITDTLYQGTVKPITVRYKLALVIDDDKFTLALREVGAGANSRAKAEELMESAKAAFFMPVYAGEYDAR